MHLLPIAVVAALLASSAVESSAQDPAASRLPKLNDPALRIEALCRAPEIEAPATVAAAPDGSFYVGCDPRDTRLNTKEPVCTVVRYSSMGPEKKRTVFAEKLYSPAGSLWHDGWLYVIHDPLMSRFKDTDGDGVADVREDLITNLGLKPYEGINDHVVSGFTLGMDGYFYISVGDRGIYQARSVKEVEAAKQSGAPVAELSLEGGGVIRCRPDGTQLEIFSTGTRNHLSVLLDAEDNVFTRDNTDDGQGWWSRVTHHVEGGYYGYPFDYQGAPNNGVTVPSEQTKATARGGKGGFTPGGDKPAAGQPGMKVDVPVPVTVRPFLPAMTDFGGGSPTGGVCYLSDGLPEQYRGKLLFSEWGKSTLFATEVAREGATFKLLKDTPLVQSDGKVDFRPMEVSIANDGSILIADWGWGGWKSDRTEGVIWRVSWPEAKPSPRLQDEGKATVEELISALRHADRGQRLRAQMALTARRADLSGVATDAKAPLVQRQHALWALAGQVATSTSTAESAESRAALQTLRSLLQSARQEKEGPLVAQVVRALGQSGSFSEVGMIDAGDLDLRRHVITALGRTREPEQELASALVRVFDQDDAWIRSAASTAFRNKPLAEMLIHHLAGGNLPAGLWPVLATVPTVENVALLSKIAASTDSDEQRLALRTLGRIAYQQKPYDGRWWGTQPVKTAPPLPSVAWEGTPAAIDALTNALHAEDPTIRLAAAEALSFGVGKEALPALRQQLQGEADRHVRAQLIASLAVQRDPEAMPVFTSLASDESAQPEFRVSAIHAIGSLGGEEAKKTLAELAGAQLPTAVLLPLLEATARLKVLEAAPALIRRLQEQDVEVREKAIKALAAIGPKSSATAALLAALSDSQERIRMEAMNALGSFKDPAALPQLIALAKETAPNRSDRRRIADHERGTLLRAIGNMADASAVPVLVEALTENANRRRDVIKVLKGLRSEAWPLIEQRLASGEISAQLEPEIRAAFESGAIAKWRIIGPFENVWAAVHPPEADALANGGAADLAKQYESSQAQPVSWREVAGEGEQARLDLERLLRNNGLAAAYAYAQIDASEAAEAKIFAGSDDQLAIWLNGEKVHDFAGTRSFAPDTDEVPVRLRAGVNHLLVKIGNQSGTWEFAARMPGLQGSTFVRSKEPAPEVKQRAFALATKPDGAWLHAGDAVRGEKLFFDPNAPMGAICATCHVVKGKGGIIGPELSAVGTNYKRADLITSIHEPAKTIALGYEQVMVETRSGEAIAGSLRSEAGDVLTILSADGQTHTVPKNQVKTTTHLHGSLMPPGLTLSLKPEEFADLLAYLESLRGH